MRIPSMSYVTLIAAMASAPAFAADVVVEAPLESEAYNWSGVYVGVQGGGGWGDSDIRTEGVEIPVDLDGAFLGGYVAALWQFDKVVAGIEGEVNYSWIDGENEFQPGNFFRSEINWFGSVNAKIGLPIDRLLVFATGGVALGELATGQEVAPSSFEEEETSVGWTVGAGADYAVTDQVIVGVQYRYYDFGDESFSPGGGFSDRDQDVTLHTVSLRASYKF
jgi:outer membrane immunogenic protein